MAPIQLRATTTRCVSLRTVEEHRPQVSLNVDLELRATQVPAVPELHTLCGVAGKRLAGTNRTGDPAATSHGGS